MTELGIIIKYSFADASLLEVALTHSSWANENRASGIPSNERLEFLGDSILGYVVADHLYRTMPDMPEGRMTRLRAELVCEQSLLYVARTLELGAHIRLGRGEELTGGRERPSILADCVEAVIAAVYLDGGIEPARAFIAEHILSRVKESLHSEGDFKTELQELVQRTSGHLLAYEVVSESGPDHHKLFTVRVTLDGTAVGEGDGRTKKEAEQSAARAAMEELRK